MSIAVKSGLPSLGSTEGAVISADEAQRAQTARTVRTAKRPMLGTTETGT